MSYDIALGIISGYRSSSIVPHLKTLPVLQVYDIAEQTCMNILVPLPMYPPTQAARPFSIR